MMSSESLTKQIKDLLVQSLISQDPQAKVLVDRTSFGWLYPYIVTSLFENKDREQRREQIDAILAVLNLNLEGLPFSNFELLTPQEAAEQPFAPVEMPLWSEILMVSDPEEPVTLSEQHEKRPFVVTFYSYKDSVSRSASLAFVASILATSGYRVVMIDFDLKAPGISLVQADNTSEANTYGVLDYIYQRYFYPKESIPAINECIRQIGVSAPGQLFLIPAGAYDERYIHILADLNVRLLYRDKVNPIHQLLQEVKESLTPNVILIDASAGFAEVGAAALFDQADLGVICFSPSRQNYAGLEWVVKAASRQKKYNGIPDLRFLLTLVPNVAPVQQQERLTQAVDWISQHWDVPSPLSVDELYYHVPYDPNVLALDDLFSGVPEDILKWYEPLAKMISASLPGVAPMTLDPPDC